MRSSGHSLAHTCGRRLLLGHLLRRFDLLCCVRSPGWDSALLPRGTWLTWPRHLSVDAVKDLQLLSDARHAHRRHTYTREECMITSSGLFMNGKPCTGHPENNPQSVSPFMKMLCFQEHKQGTKKLPINAHNSHQGRARSGHSGRARKGPHSGLPWRGLHPASNKKHTPQGLIH